MAVSTYAGTPVSGVDFDERYVPSLEEPAKHALGTTVRGLNGELWIHVVASGAVAIGTCTVNTTTYAVTDAAGAYTATAAFTSGQVGWVYLTASVPTNG
jgi:hypothetical protein